MGGSYNHSPASAVSLDGRDLPRASSSLLGRDQTAGNVKGYSLSQISSRTGVDVERASSAAGEQRGGGQAEL